ncbi:unnamed protein product [Rotaria sp. Silwood1]|nr:unnamed protein product [Rotaria sp. Silwood1]
MCVCDINRFSNRFLFNHTSNNDCQGYNRCENGGQCFQNNETCPTKSTCICPDCYYGAKCQFSTKSFMFSLDSILGYHIKPKISFNRQPLIIKISILISTIILISGLISGLLSIVTFRRKKPRQVGTGYYLLLSSITSIFTIIILTIKFWRLIFSQMSLINNRSILYFNCISIDVILKIFLSSSEWLNACVAIERIISIMKGVHFNRKKRIARLIAKKAYDNCFPLHEPLRDDVANIDDSELNDREKLKKHWATMSQCLKFQPLSLIRSYMGEKMTFYFALSGFYNQMLILPAFVGLIVFIYGAASVASDEPTSDICGSYGNSTYMCPRCDKTCPFWKLIDSCVYSKVSYVFDNVSTVVFAFLMSLWARWFIERWKRREAVLRYDWDSIDFDENLEPIRPEFENEAQKIDEKRINPVTNMLIVCATIFAIIVYRVQMDYILRETSVKQYSSIIITVTSAIMNLICSILLSQFYYWVARKLTDLELHKYQSNYDDSLTIKIYLFQFVNFYSSLFYIAFFKGRFDEYPSKYGESSSKDFTEQCDPAGCFVELAIQFLIIMTGKQIVNNILEFFFAICGTCACVCCNRDIDTKKEQWEIDKNLNNFESTTLIDEYLELVIQFGFVTLFVIAFPLAPLFALINNLIEVRLDAWKFLSKYKRPIPHKASDIGIWGNIMSAVSYLAVLTNAVVIAWTSEFIPKMAYRSLQSTGTSLSGYVNWTLSSFPIADYNLTGTMPSGVPSGLTYCRYRDFRESTGPSYSHTSVYWNVTAARLVFIILFEHIIFIFIYLMQWLVPDVPKSIQDKIAHERYIDQRERWASNKREENIKKTDHNSRETSKTIKNLPFPITYPGNIKSSADVKSPVNDKSPVDDKSPVNVKSPTVKSKRRTIIRARISPKDTY